MAFIPQHNDLLAALQDPGELGVHFTLSPALRTMFLRSFGDRVVPHLPALDPGTAARIDNRFIRDQRLYRNIVNNGPAHAVLYSIRDMEAKAALYAVQRRAVRDHINNQVAALALAGAPTAGQLVVIFTAERDRLAALPAPDPAITAQLELYNHYLNAGLGNDKIVALQAHLASGDTVATWFGHADQIKEVDDLAHADFYRLGASRDAAITAQRIGVRDFVRGRVNALGRTPSLKELTDILTVERDRLLALGPAITAQQVTQWYLYNHYITAGGVADLRTHLFNSGTVDAWFALPNQVNEANHIGRTNTALTQVVATETGQIYGPGPLHNWGMNCGWLLGLINRNVPIISLSPINANNQFRGHPGLAPNPNPSAFALEISTLMTAGYTLTYNAGAISYARTRVPTVPLTMDGAEGYGLLQTRVNQDLVYREVMAHIALGGNFANWVPPTIAAQDAVALRVRDFPAEDAQSARNVNIRAADLILIANRTADTAVLVDIATRADADARVFAAVLANANINGATRTAIASNNSADAVSLAALVGLNDANIDALVAVRPNTSNADLRTIAQRTHSAAVLAAIAARPDADANVFADIRANAALNGATWLAIANNDSADAASLAALVGLNDANIDALVAVRPNTSNADLRTIAQRTHSAAVLAAIAARPDADANVFADIRANAALNGATWLAIANNDSADAASLAALVGLNDANIDALVAVRRHTANADLRTIAQRTNSAAVLAAIAARPDADANVFADIRANAALNGATWLAIANNDSADAASLTQLIAANHVNIDALLAVRRHTANADLRTIAQRTNSAAVLAAIAARPDADAPIFADILGNAALDWPTCSTIANNDGADAVSLAALVGLNNPNIDALVAARPHASNPNLGTIAQRTHSAPVLTTIANRATSAVILAEVASNPHADAVVFTAVLANANINGATRTAVASNNSADAVSLAALVGLNDANIDALVAARRHTANVDLRTIAQRTNSTAVLAAIAARPDADANVFADIRANAALNGATRTAIASNNSADAVSLAALVGLNDANIDALVAVRRHTANVDLRTIAQRTNSAAVLAAIAARPDADAHIFADILGNAALDWPTCSTIANNDSADAVSLAALVGLNNPNIDALIAVRRHTANADLRTIAQRTHSAAVLAAIAARPDADAHIFADILGNAALDLLTYFTIANNNSADAVSLTALVGLNNTHIDALAAARPNTSGPSLRTIAQRTTRTAVLTTIANRTTNAVVLAEVASNINADAAVFAAVLANVHINGATRTAIANNNSADAVSLAALVGLNDANIDALVVARAHTSNPDLRTIAQRTHSAPVLTAITNRATSAAVLTEVASNLHANAGVFAAVLANVNINGATRTAIASNNSADGVSLAALVGLNDANIDALVVARPNVLAAELITIANRHPGLRGQIGALPIALLNPLVMLAANPPAPPPLVFAGPGVGGPLLPPPDRNVRPKLH
jgi:spore coat protein CotF